MPCGALSQLIKEATKLNLYINAEYFSLLLVSEKLAVQLLKQTLYS